MPGKGKGRSKVMLDPLTALESKFNFEADLNGNTRLYYYCAI